MPSQKAHKNVVRLMVLETDKPHEDTETKRGSFGEILHNHFTKAGEEHDPPLGVETDMVYIVTEEGGRMPKLEEFDGFNGILITGSKYDAHGDNPWILDLLKLLRNLWIHRPDMSFTGVCFGHQVLARLLGSKVTPSPTDAWELGHTKIYLSSIGQKLFQTDENHIYLHQMHKDHVVAPPSPETADGLLDEDTRVEIWGHSDHTTVQGLYIKGRLFTTQAHLAFDETMVNQEIDMRVESDDIKDLEHADRAAETAHLEHDGDKVAAAILRMFHFEDDGVERDGDRFNK